MVRRVSPGLRDPAYRCRPRPGLRDPAGCSMFPSETRTTIGDGDVAWYRGSHAVFDTGVMAPP